MRNTKFVVFSLMALVLSACGGNNQPNGSDSSNQGGNSQNPDAPIVLVNPEDTSMLTANSNKYNDDMRTIDNDVRPYKYH